MEFCLKDLNLKILGLVFSKTSWFYLGLSFLSGLKREDGTF